MVTVRGSLSYGKGFTLDLGLYGLVYRSFATDSTSHASSPAISALFLKTFQPRICVFRPPFREHLRPPSTVVVAGGEHAGYAQ